MKKKQNQSEQKVLVADKKLFDSLIKKTSKPLKSENKTKG